MTTSPETQRLIALCRDWSDGRLSDAELRQAVHARQQQALKARADFTAGSNAETDAGRVVRGAFDSYLFALAAIGKCRADAMPGCVNALQHASEALFWAFQGCFAKYPVEGPTRYPVLNALLEAEGDVEARTQEARSFLERCLQELREAPESEPADAIALVSSGLQQCLDGLPDAEKIRAAMAVIDEGWALYAVRKAGGPTSSTVANSYVSAADAVREGRWSAELFLQSLDVLEEYVKALRRDFLGAELASGRSPSVQAQMARARDALRLQEEACADFRGYGDAYDARRLEAGKAKLIEATQTLDDVAAALRTVGRAVCAQCSHPNEPGARFCSSCNAPLARFVQTEEMSTSFSILEGGAADMGEGPVMTENLKRLIDDSDAVAEGRISLAEYLATLDWMEGLLLDSEAERQRMPDIESDDPDLLSAAELTRTTEQLFDEGVAQMHEGLVELRAFAADGDPGHLTDGLRTAWLASQSIYRARRVSESIVSDLPDDAPEQPPDTF